MSVVVIDDKCTACGMCVEICPGDLLTFSNDKLNVRMRQPADCWDCMACVKVCPCEALETKLPYQLAYFKASLKPTVLEDRIIWRVTDINGRTEEFLLRTKEI